MAARKSSKQSRDDAFAEKLLADLRTKEPQITAALATKIETRLAAAATGQARRAALATLMMPFAKFERAANEDAEGAAALAEALAAMEEDAKFYRAIADLLDTASVWTLFALAGREDYEQIRAAASQGADA